MSRLSYEDAVAVIEQWYHTGERYIAVTREVAQAYADGLIAARYYSRTIPPRDKFNRQFFAYKAAVVFYPGGWL